MKLGEKFSIKIRVVVPQQDAKSERVHRNKENDVVQLHCLGIFQYLHLFTPARILGVSDKKGELSVGKDADIVIFDGNINIFTTIIGGRIVYDGLSKKDNHLRFFL